MYRVTVNDVLSHNVAQIPVNVQIGSVNVPVAAERFYQRIGRQVYITMLSEFYYFMKDNGTSESYQKNNLKTVISFTRYLGNGTNVYDIQRIEHFLI
jgi:hypothetical protein